MISLIADSELLKSDVSDLFTNVILEKICGTEESSVDRSEGSVPGLSDTKIFRSALEEAHASITIQCNSLVDNIVSNIAR